jgi:hypothetical protein
LNQGHRKTHRVSHPVSSLLLLAGLAGGAVASDYPPPPGPYQSDPTLFADPPPPTDHEMAATAGTPASSRILPLPDVGPNRERGAYDSTNLFGARPGAPRHPNPMKSPEAGGASTRFAPTTYPADSYSTQQGVPEEFRRDSLSFAPGYPQYAPPYPPNPPYPGQHMEHAPVGPGHPAYASPSAPVYSPPATSKGGFRSTATTRRPYPSSDTMAPGAGTLPRADDVSPANPGEPIFRPPGALPTQ